jgi:hypothetical protein
VLRGEAQSRGHLELLEGAHHAIEPRKGSRSEAVGPAQPRTHISDTEVAEYLDSFFEAMVLEVKPLADSQLGGMASEGLQSGLCGSVLTNQPEIEMPVIRRALGLLMPRRRRPCPGQVEQGVPVNAGSPAD